MKQQPDFRKRKNTTACQIKTLGLEKCVFLLFFNEQNQHDQDFSPVIDFVEYPLTKGHWGFLNLMDAC